MPRFDVTTRTVPRGHVEGREDRDVLIAEVRDSWSRNRVVWTRKFSANWEPHSFAVRRETLSELPYSSVLLLKYTVGTERHAMVLD